MKLLIASDIHGSLSMARKLADVCQKAGPDFLVLLGDILYHGPRNPLPDNYNPAEVIKVLAGLEVPITAVRGNCDAEVDELVLPFHLAENAWLLDGQVKIFAIHGHQLKINGGLLDAPSHGAVLSGHSHVPTAEKKGEIHFWNPGSTSLPKQNFPASYGLYEQGRFSVITFDGETLMSDSLPR